VFEQEKPDWRTCVKAFRLLEAEQPAMLVDVPVPKPKAGSGQVVIKVGGAGLCHTDRRYGATCVDLAVGKRYDMR
jgi:Zn-dependent alcohol dehydrogenase